MSVIAYRRWRVGRNGELWALRDGSGYVWPPAGPALALCLCNTTTRELVLQHFFGHDIAEEATPDGEVPHPSMWSACGLYGYTQPVPACQCPEPLHERHGAVGVIRLWSRAVEHEHGWRALYAEPVAVVDYTGRLNAAYTMPRYHDLATMYGEWAPDLTEHDHEPGIWCGYQPPQQYPGQLRHVPIPISWTAHYPPSFTATFPVSHEVHQLHEGGPEPAGPKQRTLDARKNRDISPRRNPFRRRGRS